VAGGGQQPQQWACAWDQQGCNARQDLPGRASVSELGLQGCNACAPLNPPGRTSVDGRASVSELGLQGCNACAPLNPPGRTSVDGRASVSELGLQGCNACAPLNPPGRGGDRECERRTSRAASQLSSSASGAPCNFRIPLLHAGRPQGPGSILVPPDSGWLTPGHSSSCLTYFARQGVAGLRSTCATHSNLVRSWVRFLRPSPVQSGLENCFRPLCLPFLSAPGGR